MKRYALIVLVALFFQNSSSQTVVRGPYLQLLTSSGIKIKWRTDTAAVSRVYYGTDSSNLTLYVDDTASVINHTVQLSDLQPYTTYYYSIGTATQTLDGPSALHRFKTAPVEGTVQPYRFWGIGDFGKANQGQVDVLNSYLDYIGDNHTDLWLWLGDNAYNDGTDQEYQTKVFDIYKDIMKYMPFYSCPGNHDYNSVCRIPCFSGDPRTHSGPYFDIIDVPTAGEAGGVASGYELYYSFNYGNVHFISLNSELGSSNPANNYEYDWNGVFSASAFANSPVRQWLIDDLTAVDPEVTPWVIVYFHQPPYTDGSHHSDDSWELYIAAMRNNYLPILEQYKVDMVLCGHSHVYERSYLMRGFHGPQYPTSSTFDKNIHVIDTSSGNFAMNEPYFKYTDGPSVNIGTVYVIDGNSGSREEGAPLNHPAMIAGDDDYGSFILDVNGSRLDGKYLRRDGSILDDFTIIKKSSISGISELVSEGVHLFPNPVTNELQVVFSKEMTGELQIEVYNSMGKRMIAVQRESFNADREIIPMADLSPGVYTVKVRGKTVAYAGSIMKQ